MRMDVSSPFAEIEDRPRGSGPSLILKECRVRIVLSAIQTLTVSVDRETGIDAKTKRGLNLDTKLLGGTKEESCLIIILFE